MLFLVVDDDALSRDLLTLLLEAEGHEVHTAASGEAAVAWVESRRESRQAHADVILTDIQMPGIAGIALADALRALSPTQTILLAMSGSQPRSEVITGFNGFLLKPFTMSELATKTSLTETATVKAKTLAEEIEPVKRSERMPESERATGPEPPALDEDIYAKMRELMPATQLGQMYTLCVNDARKRVSHMRALAEAGDDEQYRGQAHAVKGGCGMIGASELHMLAAEAEREGLAESGGNFGTTGAAEVLMRLSRACDRLERILVERTLE